MYLIKKFRQVISFAASNESGGDLTLMLGQIEGKAVSYNDIVKLAEALEVLEKIREGSNADSLSIRVRDGKNYGDGLAITFESAVENKKGETRIVRNDQLLTEDQFVKSSSRNIFLEFLDNIKVLVHKTQDIFYGDNTEEGS